MRGEDKHTHMQKELLTDPGRYTNKRFADTGKLTDEFIDINTVYHNATRSSTVTQPRIRHMRVYSEQRTSRQMHFLKSLNKHVLKCVLPILKWLQHFFQVPSFDFVFQTQKYSI